MNIIIFNFIFLTFTPNNQVWRSEPIFVVPSAYVLEQKALTWNFPFHLRYGLNKNVELLSGALWYTAKGDYWNYYGALGFKFGLWDDFESKPVAISTEIEAKGWGSISGRYLTGLRGCLVLSKHSGQIITLHAFANYGWNNFGKSLGPLDFYLDKMKLKIVPMLGFGLQFALSERLWLMGEGFYSQGEFYCLGEKRWSKENLLAYIIGVSFKFNVKQNLPSYFRCGLCFLPKQAFDEYSLQTEMVEQGEVRSFRNAWWLWRYYKVYLGLSILIKKGKEL